MKHEWAAFALRQSRNEYFFLNDKETAASPWAMLRTLEEASRNFENDEDEK